jgi:hypothetical protein
MKTVGTGLFLPAKSQFRTSSNEKISSQMVRITRKTRINVRLQPRASRDELLGWNEEGTLRVRVKAPPVDGAANAALIQLLAKRLGVAKNRVTLIAGATARNKVVEIEGVTDEELRKELAWHPGPLK